MIQQNIYELSVQFGAFKVYFVEYGTLEDEFVNMHFGVSTFTTYSVAS